MESSKVKRVSSYIVLIFESLHTLHVGISKLMKDYTVNILTSDRLLTGGPKK